MSNSTPILKHLLQVIFLISLLSGMAKAAFITPVALTDIYNQAERCAECRLQKKVLKIRVPSKSSWKMYFIRLIPPVRSLISPMPARTFKIIQTIG